MQTDPDQVRPVPRKAQSAPLSHITSKCTFQTSSEVSWGVGNAFRVWHRLQSVALYPLFLLYSTLPSTRHSRKSGQKKIPGKFPPCKCRSFLHGCTLCCAFRGQKQGAEQCCWILIHVHYQRSLSNASPLMKRWLFLAGVSLNHKLEQAKMRWNENREREAPAGPLWGLLGYPCLRQLELSPNSQKNKETIFCVEGFCCCCRLFPVPCPTFQREKWIFDCSN